MALNLSRDRVRDPEEDRIEVSQAMRRAGAGAFSFDDRFDMMEDSIEEVYKAMEAVRRRERLDAGEGRVLRMTPPTDADG